MSDKLTIESYRQAVGIERSALNSVGIVDGDGFFVTDRYMAELWVYGHLTSNEVSAEAKKVVIGMVGKYMKDADPKEICTRCGIAVRLNEAGALSEVVKKDQEGFLDQFNWLKVDSKEPDLTATALKTKVLNQIESEEKRMKTPFPKPEYVNAARLVMEKEWEKAQNLLSQIITVESQKIEQHLDFVRSVGTCLTNLEEEAIGMSDYIGELINSDGREIIALTQLTNWVKKLRNDKRAVFDQSKAGQEQKALLFLAKKSQKYLNPEDDENQVEALKTGRADRLKKTLLSCLHSINGIVKSDD